MNVVIRKEKRSDVDAIDSVTAEAFLGAKFSDQTEHLIVLALRDSGALSVSLVAEDSVQIVGHVAVSPVSITDGTKDWYGLGPISVRPDVQSNGIGSKLMYRAINELKTLGANGCVLLGNPGYYNRFGFELVDDLVLPNVPPEYFQALLLQGEYPKGEVSYHESFSVQR